MFHQIRMWCCLSYMVANVLMLLSDTGICDGRHTNMAFSLALMFFYQGWKFMISGQSQAYSQRPDLASYWLQIE